MFTEFLLKRMEITVERNWACICQIYVSGCFSPEKVFLATLFMCVPVLFSSSSPMIIIHTARAKSSGFGFFCCGRCAASRPLTGSAAKSKRRQVTYMRKIWCCWLYLGSAEVPKKKFMVKLLLFRKDFLKHFDGHHMYNVWTSCVRTPLMRIHPFFSRWRC